MELPLARSLARAADLPSVGLSMSPCAKSSSAHQELDATNSCSGVTKICREISKEPITLGVDRKSPSSLSLSLSLSWSTLFHVLSGCEEAAQLCSVFFFGFLCVEFFRFGCSGIS